MTPTSGLDLETFLGLLRADVGVWVSLGAIVLLLAVMAWTRWGSRRALRKCLALSVVVHLGLVWQGGPLRGVWEGDSTSEALPKKEEGIRRIRVEPVAERDVFENGSKASKSGVGKKPLADWDRHAASRFPWLDVSKRVARLDSTKPKPAEIPLRNAVNAPAPLPDSEIPEADLPEVVGQAARPKSPAVSEADASNDSKLVADADPDDVAAAIKRGAEADDRTKKSEDGPEVNAAKDSTSTRLRGERLSAGNPKRASDRFLTIRPDSTARLPISPDAGAGDSVATAPGPIAPTERANENEAVREVGDPAGKPDKTASDSATASSSPKVSALGPDELPARVEARKAEGKPPSPPSIIGEGNLRRRSRLDIVETDTADPTTRLSQRRPQGSTLPLEIARTTPEGDVGFADLSPGPGERPLDKVPEIYRVRLDRDRSARALRDGASLQSEQAVERALDWLARHQDADGRWNAGTVKRDGVSVSGEENFTMHCPPGEICFGECHYAEADSAITGLALLAFLGAGRSESDGEYAETVRKGVDFLLSIQKDDGDLRGSSKAVGMYCHAMASLALCEAYALGRDPRLRDPVRRAVAFLVRSRAGDGIGWRYLPGDPRGGDTSILGWVVMVLKSAKEVGVEIDDDSRSSALKWLDKVASGSSSGLARYRHSGVEARDDYVRVTPTMTAEAWLCRQFLGAGGPSAASDEAAAFLLKHPPSQATYNLYYYYYATLSMFQRGGVDWARWNVLVRDDLVRRQKVRGHQAGSWEPDDSPYGAYGGRIYCTALATLTLEVYYRYLRLQNPVEQPDAPVLRRAQRRPNGIR